MLTRMLSAAKQYPNSVFTAAVGSSSNLTNYTFNSVNIGTAQAKRVVVVCVVLSGNNSGTISSITIGGTTANLNKSTTDGTLVLGVGTLVVASGATANIVVNTNASWTNGCGILVYAVYGLANATQAAYVTQSTGTATTASANITVNAGDTLIATVRTATTTTVTWSGVSGNGSLENYSGTRSFYGGTNFNTTSGTKTITATFSASVSRQLQIVALR